VKYALVVDNRVAEYRIYDQPPECKHIDGLPMLRPLSELPPPVFDPDLQTLQPSINVLPDRVELGHVVVDLPVAQAIANLGRALATHLDAAAAARGYDSIHTAALRAAYPGPFAAEGLAYAQWMDACNAVAASILAAVNEKRRPLPSAVELIAELPQIALPDDVHPGRSARKN
jgi:hypothetical protein